MSNYFDPLIDVVSAEAIQAAGDAMAAHVWHGAGNQDEATLLHGVRALIKAVRAEEEARYRDEARRLREFNLAQDKRRAAANRDWLRSVDGRTKDAVGDRDRVFQMLLTAGVKGRKTLLVSDLRAALRMDAPVTS